MGLTVTGSGGVAVGAVRHSDTLSGPKVTTVSGRETSEARLELKRSLEWRRHFLANVWAQGPLTNRRRHLLAHTSRFMACDVPVKSGDAEEAQRLRGRNHLVYGSPDGSRVTRCISDRVRDIQRESLCAMRWTQSSTQNIQCHNCSMFETKAFFSTGRPVTETLPLIKRCVKFLWLPTYPPVLSLTGAGGTIVFSSECLIFEI